jgi:lysophospholipase L1-like esterase
MTPTRTRSVAPITWRVEGPAIDRLTTALAPAARCMKARRSMGWLMVFLRTAPYRPRTTPVNPPRGPRDSGTLRPAKSPTAKSAALSLVLASAPAVAGEPLAPFALKDGDRVVFYGDSITQEGGYARFVEEYVRTRFPHWDIRFYNAGVGGDTVDGGWAGPVDVRLERDVIALKPTVVTIMLGMNDGGYKPFDPMTLATFGEGYRAIVAKLQRSLPEVRLTFIRSSPFDDVARPPQFAPGYDDALRRLGCYVTTLGAREKAIVVDFRDPVNAGIAGILKDDPDLARQVVPDRVHPGPAGHIVMGATLLRAAWNARLSWPTSRSTPRRRRWSQPRTRR